VSNINYASIDENFPIAGQDNDTQTFRDNFDTIKTSLRVAQEEVTDLQDNTARTDQDNDFNKKVISKAVLINNREKVLFGGNYIEGQGIDYESGNYQVWNFRSNMNVFFSNLPGDPVIIDEVNNVGKMTLEFYAAVGDTSPPYKITFTTTGGTVVKKSGFPTISEGDLELSSTSDPVIVEVWRHSSDKIFIKYVGQFS
jgi:hypothetical protein